MNKTTCLRTLRTLNDVSPFTKMINAVFQKNENGRWYHAYSYDDDNYKYRDNQILFWADSERCRFRRERDSSIRKKHGGLRQITAPMGRMRELLMCINDILTTLYKPTPWAYGFVTKRSVVDNARLHVGKRYVLNIDLHDFFPSITLGQVASCLMSEPYSFSEYAANLIANLCVVCRDGHKHLPQGFPTSPVLSNMVCAQMDSQLAELAEQNGVTYSRYADDMTFSSDNDVLHAPDGNFFAQTKNIIESFGFTLNEKKTRLQRRGQQRQEVTGLNVTDKVNTTRRYMREIRSQLYIWERYGYAELCKAAYPHYKQQHGKTKGLRRHANMAHILMGKIAYLGMVRGKDDGFYIKCAARLNKLLTDNSKEIKRVEDKAVAEACERENRYIKKIMSGNRFHPEHTDGILPPEHNKTWNTVLKIILFAAVFLLILYLRTLIK